MATCATETDASTVPLDSGLFETRRDEDFRTTELRLAFAGRLFTERLFMELTI